MADPTPKEIRERHSDLTSSWKDIREDGDIDMKCVAGDPWPEKEKEARREAMRPMISPDELGQYINQLVNEIRQNKRSPKVNPRGNGANDKTAAARADIIRGIEYNSKAQGAYCGAFENSVSRSYGFWMLGRRFTNPEDFEQELYIRRIPNPDSVLIDYNTKEADHSDMDDGFVEDVITRAKFKSQYPNAEIVDFTNEHMVESEGWIQDKLVRIAEYWKVQSKPDELFLLDNGKPEGFKVLKSALGKDPRIANSTVTVGSQSLKILRQRKTTSKEVFQYITNGMEVLEKKAWLGCWVPIIPCFGKEIWVKEGGQTKRKLMSLVRLARDPYMLYCYYRTAQAEVVGMTPKTPYIGYEGQFATNTDWANINRVPVGFAEVKFRTEESQADGLPLPRREIYDPPIQSLELGAEAARRAIQAAMGISPLPTAAQRQNEKSGVALKRIDAQQQKGSFHFIDNYDMALENCGRQIDYLLGKVHPNAQDLPIQKADGAYTVMRVNDPEHRDPKTQEPAVDLNQGSHDVTISVGPSSDSQREEASDFLGLIIQNIEQMPLDPQVKAKFMALLIKMKNLGHFGDQMAELLDPDEGSPEAQHGQLLQMKQQAQLQIQQLHAYAGQLEGELKKLQAEKQGKIVDNEYKMALEKLKIDADLAKAEIMTKSQQLSERLQFVEDVWKELHGSAHERALQTQDHAHAAEQAASAQEAASQSQLADQQHQAGMAAQAAESANASM